MADNVLGSLFQDQADAIREGLGQIGLIKPIDTPDLIRDIVALIGTGGGMGGVIGGGGSADDRVKYVTFMYGATELYKQPVVAGDTCHDPYVDKNIKDEDLKKESTAQYDYTFNGWSMTEGGSADPDALKNVTEDRTVYAAFKADVRYYTITWLDEDGTELPGQKQWAYGTVPSYTPTKEGVAFSGWTPKPAAVTGDASYTASWSSVYASGTCGTNVTWALFADGTLRISGTGAMDNVQYNYTTPTTVFTPYKDRITSIVIEDGVTSVGNTIFYELPNLTSVTLADSVTRIGSYSFYGCKKLSSFNFGNGITYIDAYAFKSCEGLTSVVLPDTVTTIMRNAFYECITMKNIILPNGIKTITESMFEKCKALTAITIPNSVTNIGRRAFATCTALTNLVIPDSVTTLGDYAFEECPSATSLTIGGGLKTISKGAFRFWRALPDVTIPENVTKICSAAFQYNDVLASVTFEVATGWSAGSTALAESDLTDTAKAAEYLKTTHATTDWTRT